MSGAITITSLSATPVSLTGAELIPVVQSGGTFRAPVSALGIFAPVQSVNGQTGDTNINATNLPGLALVGRTNSYTDLDNAPVSVVTSSTLANVAFSGDYTDLTNSPALTTLATTQINSLPAVVSTDNGDIVVEQAGTARRLPLVDVLNSAQVRTVAIGVAVPGTPQSAEVYRIPLLKAYSWPENLVGSVIDVGSSPNAAYEISVRLASQAVGGTGTEFAKVSVAVSTFEGIPSAVTAFTNQVGDILVVQFPTTTDVSIANIGISFLVTET